MSQENNAQPEFRGENLVGRFRQPQPMNDQLQLAVQDLYRRQWPIGEYDIHLKNAVGTILNSIGARGFLASQRMGQVRLYCAASFGLCAQDEAAGRQSVVEFLDESKVPADEFHSLNSGDVVLSWSLTSSDHKKQLVSRAVIIFRWSEVWDKLGTPKENFQDDEFFKDHFGRFCRCLLPMLLDAFRHRDRRFAAFPPEIVQKYWEDANKKNSKVALLQPPWEPQPNRVKLRATATLSIDLRKSTYCMEFARSEREFGEWLDHLVEKMRSVAHLHGGIFDKFTGDGALIHFLERESRAIYGLRSVDAAVHCAVDLQRAVEIHLANLRRFLHHDSEQFGAGIAIDVGKAFWSCDHRDNPVVVGKVVVGACRVGDKVPRKHIRLTNIAYQALSREVRQRLSGIRREKLGETKETPGALELECWQFHVDREVDLGKGIAAIKRLCCEIKERFLVEKGSRRR